MAGIGLGQFNEAQLLELALGKLAGASPLPSMPAQPVEMPPDVPQGPRELWKDTHGASPASPAEPEPSYADQVMAMLFGRGR